MACRRRRFALLITLSFACSPAIVGMAGQGQALKAEVFEGKIVPLAAVLEKQGARIDVDAAAVMMTFQTNDGKTLVLIKDEGSRMFFLDKGLLNRPMRLTARLLPNTQLLQVIKVNSLVKGQLHEVYWWCETCSIRDTEPGLCHCCGAMFDYRELPVK